MIEQKTLIKATCGRQTVDMTADVQEVVADAGVQTGICMIFIQHTSASLMLCENVDPDVRRDMETFMLQLVRDGDPAFRHDAEGPDDMSAHVRSVLTGPSHSVPVSGGRLLLGTWQGIYLWEHRTWPHERHVTVTVYGE